MRGHTALPQQGVLGWGSQLCAGSLRGFRPCPSLSPISEQISRRQSQVDRLYVALKELGEERRVGLEQQYWLYQLSRQVDELEHWIAEKEVVAGSPELGQDFEHVTVSFAGNNVNTSGYCICNEASLGLSFPSHNVRIITAPTSWLFWEPQDSP